MHNDSLQLKAVEHVLMEGADMCAQRTAPQSMDTLAPVGVDTPSSGMAAHVNQMFAQ